MEGKKTHKMLQNISFSNNINREGNKWIGPVCHNTQSKEHESVDNLHSKHAWVV